MTEGGAALRARCAATCHTHSDWSDGGSPIDEMARTARDLGHEYLVLTDHSPRLTVANGLSPARLRSQLDLVAELNEQLAPFRILTGIEVDILDDGSLDQEDELLARLDVVVARVHSKLRMPAEDMTRRMVTAVANPHIDMLGHCTGRLRHPRGRGGKVRPESEFDAEIVFEACRRFGVAVEINSPAGAAGPAPAAAVPGRGDGLPASRSTPTPTRRASWTGSPTAARGRRSAACRRTGWSTR